MEVDDRHTCCFATQEKAWTRDLDGVPWELYSVVGDATGFGASPRGGTPVDKTLPPVELAELQAAIDDPDVIVIDAQGPGGFETAHLTGAVGFRLEDVAEQAADAIGDPDRRVILYCTDQDCIGAEFIGTSLAQAGYTNLGRYPDGIAGWQDSGLPVASDPPAS